MIVRSNTEIVYPLSEKLARRGVSVKILNQELKVAAECPEVIQLNAGPGGYIGVPVVLLMILEVNRHNRPQR
jgi:hypothetical protein